jgi:ferredoxin
MKKEFILPYDDVRALLQEAKSFRVIDCVCRVQQDQLGKRKCDLPRRVCLSFSSRELSPSPHNISREEALGVLDEAEEAGLVHSVSNVEALDTAMQGLSYVCNCCGCCCGILRGITEFGIENSIAYANYYAVIDPDECVGCGTCIDRCQVDAICEEDGVAIVDREKCIGCGLCVTGCPDEVPQLIRKPDAEMVHPPHDYEAWEKERHLKRDRV